MATANDTLTVIVDDRDTDRIIYSGNWRTGGTWGEFNRTTHGANNAGASCTFIFNGTSVAVFGTVDQTIDSMGTSVSTYGLDNNPVQTFSSPIALSAIRQVPFYQSPALADALHTLVITSTGAGTFWLDYILYTAVYPSSPAPVICSSSPLVSPTGNSALTSSPLVTQTSTKAASSPILASKSPKPAGAIIGGVVGGVVLSITAVLLFLFFRRYKAAAGSNSGMPTRGLSLYSICRPGAPDDVVADTELRQREAAPYPFSSRAVRPVRKVNLGKQPETFDVSAVPLRPQSRMGGWPSLGSVLRRPEVALHDDRGIWLEARTAEPSLPLMF